MASIFKVPVVPSALRPAVVWNLSIKTWSVAYNFIVLGVAAVKVAQTLNRSQSIAWLAFFALSVVSALVWAYQFYVPHNLSIAALALGLAAILTIPVLYLTFKASLLIGTLLVPYQIWVIIATTLAWGYSTRN